MPATRSAVPASIGRDASNPRTVLTLPGTIGTRALLVRCAVEGAGLGWLMTAIIYFGEMLVASLFAMVLLANSPLRISSDAALFVAGAGAWTLAEYCVHRFVLHRLMPTRHGLHHAKPDEAIRTIFWQIWCCFAPVYVIAGGAFLAGALVAYAWYLLVHHCAHHRPDRLPLALLDHHKRHHRFASRNYGVSTTIWDHVFGTRLR